MNRPNTLVRELPEGCLWVSQVTEIIKWTLERNIQDLVVAGEISNLTVSTLGHHYFTLKDEGSQLRAVMFKGNAWSLDFTPRNGMQVTAWGRITVYEKQGNYQLQVSALRPLGRGDLFERFQQLKEKLEKEGLFDKARKRRIPFFPRRVGIITSPHGAAVRDMCSITRRRNAAVSIVLIPARVQGDEAPQSLIRALETAQALSLDLLILGRGGGSVEDLWAFNDEHLVRAVAASRTPVISAVGHETDFTLCDFAADLRAPTPSAACELAIPELAKLAEQVGSLKRRLAQALQRIGMRKRMRLDQILSRKPLRFPLDRIAVLRLQLDERVRQGANAVEGLAGKRRERLFSLQSKLDALNPLSVLKRGYTLTYVLPERTPAGSAGQLKSGAPIEVVFHDGSVLAEVRDRKVKP